MELTAWRKSEELIGMLTTLSDHCQNNRRREAALVVKNIQKDGAKFQKAVVVVKKGWEEILYEKKRELEASQSKMGQLKEEVGILKTVVKETESKIEKEKENLTTHRNEIERANEANEEARREIEDGKEKIYDVSWYHFIPLVGPVVKIAEVVGGNQAVAEGESKMREAQHDLRTAMTSLEDAERRRRGQIEKLRKGEGLILHAESRIDRIHEDCTKLKDATASTLELGKVLTELLLATDFAQKKTSSLMNNMIRFKLEPGFLNCRGTEADMTTHKQRWLEVRDIIQGLNRGTNALLLEEITKRVKRL